MLFDAHIHFFPDKLKGKVFSKLCGITDCTYHRGETLEETKIHNKKFGVTHALALHIATNPKQQKAVNDFAIASQSDNLINFGSVHPLCDDKIEELYRLHENGIKGIKLHPDYQDFFAHDPKLAKVYETCEKLSMIITFHAGKDPYSPDVIHSHPKFIRSVADSYKNLRIIAAHLGGMDMSDEVIEELAGAKNVYLDTSMSSNFVSVERFREIVLLHGVDRVLFATDSPWSRVDLEKAMIENSCFSEKEKKMIYYKNAFNLFEIKEDNLMY